MRKFLFNFSLLALFSLTFGEAGVGQVRADDVLRASEEGFVPLFDGHSLNGWTGALEGYTAQDGVLSSLPDKSGNLLTDQEYSDFVLRFDVRLTPGANNGIGLRVPVGGHAATQGMEIQMLDNTAERYAKLKPYQYHGSVYGIMPAKKGFLKPVGEWNEHEIRCIGKQVTVILNGEIIVDCDLEQATQDGTLDGRAHPGLERASGHVGLLGHKTKVDYRNIRIKPLPTSTP